ncbi:hypothetical protein [Mesobacillus harenae]|uniref:hypothetical protein n=1 Tax=Mesobacillus harenae TaxID=2213203 RepID=UPI00158100F6|nr:hypothetical protein [Mesobacillus harenae]
MSNLFEDSEGMEKLLVSLIKMLGRSNEKVDELAKRVQQLELAVTEHRPKTYSFIAEPDNPNQQIRRSI